MLVPPHSPQLLVTGRPSAPAGGLRFPIWLQRWVDNAATAADLPSADAERIDWRRCLPFIGLHLACVAVFWTGTSVTAVAVALGLYVLRMFFITGFYHRYFSHRTFRTSRTFQAVMAVAGSTAIQRDPMWWAAHHVHHHAHADRPEDPHSPVIRGLFWSHVGWFMTPASFPTRDRYVKDFARFPGLRFLNRFDWVVPTGLALSLFAVGSLLETLRPALGTSGWQLLVWGFCISTIAVHHGTFTINSLAHRFGRRRFETSDDSRNSWLLALVTLGEGWHNNHHHYPSSARQGFYWWEIDLTYYGLRVLAWLGLIWDLRPVPTSALRRNLVSDSKAS